ncbi:MAG: PorT family protein [Bacteroidales bacterium]|nr:PorT family protein [Bacteroidales bacterium]
MKKILVVFMLSLLYTCINAQTAIGLKLGLQNAKLKTNRPTENPGNEYNSILGTNFGAAFNFRYDERVSFLMEINYSQKGFTYNLQGYEVKMNINYMEVPLLIKLNFGEYDLKYYGLFGPFAAYPFHIKSEYGDIKESEYPMFEGGEFKYFDLGLHIGGGIGFNLGHGRLLGEIRYCIGLGETILDNDWDSNVIQLSFGYLFKLGKN